MKYIFLALILILLVGCNLKTLPEDDIKVIKTMLNGKWLDENTINKIPFTKAEPLSRSGGLSRNSHIRINIYFNESQSFEIRPTMVIDEGFRTEIYPFVIYRGNVSHGNNTFQFNFGAGVLYGKNYTLKFTINKVDPHNNWKILEKNITSKKYRFQPYYVAN